MEVKKLNEKQQAFENLLKENQGKSFTLSEINELARAKGLEAFSTGTINSIVNSNRSKVVSHKEKREVVVKTKKELSVYSYQEQALERVNRVSRKASPSINQLEIFYLS